VNSVVIVFLCFLAQAASAQTTSAARKPSGASGQSSTNAEEPRGEIRGRCVLTQSGEGLRGVNLQLLLVDSAHQGNTSPQSVLSSADGSFTFQRLYSGNYQLSAYKAGYRVSAGSRHFVKLDANQIRSNLEVKLNRAAIITGRITGPNGSPVTDARVSAYRLAWNDGHRTLAPADSATTDDRGVYRMFHLPAGRYIVGAAGPRNEHPRNEADLQMARVFYPAAATAAEAAKIEAHWGQDVSEINLVLQRRDTFFVSGLVVDSEDGGPCRSCVLSVTSADQIAVLTNFGVAADGGYRATGLLPGRYRLTAAKASRGHHITASRTVQIGSDSVEQVNLLVGAGHAITGRVIFDPPDAAPEDSKMMVQLPSPDGAWAPDDVEIRRDHSFVASGVSAGPHRVALNGLPPGGYLKAIRIGGSDLPSAEIEVPEQGDLSQVEIVIGLDAATVAGQVKFPEQTSEGHRVTAATVALFPQQDQPGFLNEAFAPVDSNGSFKAAGLVPGSYTAFAFPAGGAMEWRDPDLRRPIENFGKSVDLKAGQSVTIELSLAPALGEP